MASSLTLSRSFYNWTSNISEDCRITPPQFYKTDPQSLFVIAESYYNQLLGTPYEGKALYWRNLFEGFEEPMILTESMFRKVLNVLEKLFRNEHKLRAPKSVDNRFLVKGVKNLLKVIKRELEINQEFGKRYPGTNSVHFIQKAMSKSYSLSDEDQQGRIMYTLFPENKSLPEKAMRFLLAQPILILHIRNFLGMGVEVLQFFLGMIGYAVDVILGRNVRNEILKSL